MNTKCPKYLKILNWFPFNKYMMNLNLLEYIMQFSSADLLKLYSPFSEKKETVFQHQGQDIIIT